MNEIQYCLKSIIVATCVSAFRRIKPYLAISPIFCHQWTRSDHLVLSSFRRRRTHQPNPFSTRQFHFFMDSLFLLLLPPQPRSFPFFFASFPAERAVGVFPLCPLSSPLFQRCQSTKLTWDLGWDLEGWNFKEDVLANLASSAASPLPAPQTVTPLTHWLTLL